MYATSSESQVQYIINDASIRYIFVGEQYQYDTAFRVLKMVRIDYIFHDKQLKGLSYYKKPLTYSDHMPVFMKLEIN